ncbi:hypothetical protein ACWGKQ_30835 [Streptomyces sp. NPDC054770]
MAGTDSDGLDAFDALGRRCAVFVAHGLDHDSTRLLRERRRSTILHHDLRQDVRRACRTTARPDPRRSSGHPPSTARHPGGRTQVIGGAA